MKKLLFVVIILLLILAGMVGAAYLYLPQIGSYLLGKAINGSVEIGTSRVSLDKGTVTVDLTGVKAKGAVTGTIGRCRLQLRLSSGLYVTYFGMSDFEITIPKGGEGPPLYPVPVELAVIEKGVLVYEGQKVTIREIRVSHFNTGGPFEFTIDAGAEGFGNLKTRGGGLFREKRSDLKGTYSITEGNLGLLKGYRGTAKSEGRFEYSEEDLFVEGRVEVSGFVMMENFLKKPIAYDRRDGEMKLRISGKKVDLHLEKLHAENAPLTIHINSEGKVVNRIEVTSGPLPTQFVLEHLDFEGMTKNIPWKEFSLQGGHVKIKDCVYERARPMRAEVNLKGLEVVYGDRRFRDIEGNLALTNKTFVLSGMRAQLGESLFYDLKAEVPLTEAVDIHARANYSVDTAEILPFLKAESVTVGAGKTTGSVEVRGGKERGYSLAGKGSFSSIPITWKNTAFTGTGDYTFTDRELRFDPLFISNGKTNLALAGRVTKDLLETGVKGSLDTALLKPIVKFPYPLSGSVDVDGRVEKRGALLAASCDASLTDVALEIPRIVKKSRGVQSRVRFRLRHDGKVLNVEDLACNLGEMVIKGSAEVDPAKGTDLNVALKAAALERVERFFFFEENKASGSMDLDVTVKGLKLPLKKLPLLKGSLAVKNASFALPEMKRPFENLNATCTFNSDSFTADVSGLKVGRSSVKQGRLHVQSISPLTFSLSVDLATFDPADFGRKEKRPFRIPQVKADSLFSNAKGKATVTAEKVLINQAELTDAVAQAHMVDGQITVPAMSARAFGGTLSAEGSVDLARDAPAVRVTGSAIGIEGEDFFKMFPAPRTIFAGRGAITGSISTRGRESGDLLSRMEGNVNVYSKDGVIRKWNLLSKIFGLLNVLDLVQGKVQLRAEGLAFTRISATLQGRDGVFTTKNFLIDSPSMLVTGTGSVDLAAATVDGRVTVSPLVTLDRMIGATPLLKHLLKEKKKGFLFVVYDVKGPLKDPNVTSSYVSSVGSRALDIIKNLFQLPVEVFQR